MLVSSSAFPLTKASEKSVGFDIKASEDVLIAVNNLQMISTGIRAIPPSGCYIRIAPRSGLATNFLLNVFGGVIDPDYEGEIKVLLFNHGKLPFQVRRGDRIAQVICEKACFPDVKEAVLLNESKRGVSGFGSSGI